MFVREVIVVRSTRRGGKISKPDPTYDMRPLCGWWKYTKWIPFRIPQRDERALIDILSYPRSGRVPRWRNS